MELIDRLLQHRALGSAPRHELEWLIAHGSLRELVKGHKIAAKGGELVEGMYILLSGRVAIFMERGTGGPQKEMEWSEGDVTGYLPYSRLHTPPGDTYTLEPTTALVVHRDHFREMIRECYEVTSICVHVMLDRARRFKSNDLQDERLRSLGKLSAGLAHELNNPASAIERSAGLLEDRIFEADRAARELGASRLTEEQLKAIDDVRACCMAEKVHGVLSPLERAEREDSLADWLAHHGLDTVIAEPLAETSVTLEALDRIAKVVTGPTLDAVLRWTASGISVRGLASEVQSAAMRISGLVAAIKGFTHMDQATVAEPVDLPVSISNTVDVLKSKAKQKSVAIAIKIERNLPKVRGFIGELNQVWANLIDNAVDAVPKSGRIEVTANQERGRVIVRIIDNGTGIPPEIREHMFEPFVTTKPVGQGTGLGLDIVRRLIIHNEGSIDVDSHPGRTEFAVSLPIANQAAAQA